MKLGWKNKVWVILLVLPINIFSQFRLIKAHSDIEDQIISLDPDLFNSYRNTRQSPVLIQNLRFLELVAQLDSVSSKFENVQLQIFNNQQFQTFDWNNPEFSNLNSTPFTSGFRKEIGNNVGFLFHPNRFFSWESSDRKDYFVINPILDLSYSHLFGPFDSALLNGRGVELYGQMGDKLSFYSQVFDYQANFPSNIDEYRLKNNVVPGLSNIQRNTFGFNDYFYATAYMDFTLLKKPNDTLEKGYKINATIGHDKQHIGSGFRSLILSNFSAPTLFLQIDYRLGPFRYQNLFKELVMDMSKDSSKTFNKKYLAMHRGSLNFDKYGFEIGFSEMVVQSRLNHGLDLNYLNPVIFYRSIERDLGSSDNILLAFDAKWKYKKIMVYGQFVIDEFNFSAMFGNRNSYLNKYGNQLGIYYHFKSSNLKQAYVQFEYNAVRPYMYSHRRGSSNYYAHYNQSLAHPLESNFREFIFRFYGKPRNLQRWSFKNTTIVSFQGLNSGNINFGSDMRLPYNSAIDRENAIMLNGEYNRRINMCNSISYYLQPNCKLEMTHQWFQKLGDTKINHNYLFVSLKLNFTETRESYLF